MPLASAASAMLFFAVADNIFTAVNANPDSVYKRVGDFHSRGVINLLYGRACHLHITGTLLLRKAFFVNQAYGFIFIHRERDALFSIPQRVKFTYFRKSANFSAFSRPWHRLVLSLEVDDALCCDSNVGY